ncbi:hypothetical protein A1Q2_06186 [Trichosporon asahii var. asahii CBS 8904]|uniref:Uncharacterized protein n=1 Tax=Trichosporon asahii var. asahii (strain CBS 8904) TaxID=1220162 RepID=K1WD09_TRIAC|nr:hypothetical protein A1Q2_06186 [Trichosporon asahii var. asahii CBS 8904]
MKGRLANPAKANPRSRPRTKPLNSPLLQHEDRCEFLTRDGQTESQAPWAKVGFSSPFRAKGQPSSSTRIRHELAVSASLDYDIPEDRVGQLTPATPPRRTRYRKGELSYWSTELTASPQKEAGSKWKTGCNCVPRERHARLALPPPVELMPAPFRPSRPESGTGRGRFCEAQRRQPTTVCLATSIDS